ncbi:MAG: hypothetical protein M0R75_16655 [Dehalococcoidia bacterium]|nr:hypothetical protein [Dehalococcoidia bacterium]
MPDPSYNGKVYLKQGAEEIVIEDEGVLTVDGVSYTGAQVKAHLAAIAALPTENVAAPAVWNDAGVLKVGTDT